MIKHIIRNITGMFDEAYNRLLFFYRKAVYQTFPHINGRLYMVSSKGMISFGESVRINSSLKSNPIGGSARTILFAEPGAQIIIGSNVGISNSAIHAAKEVVVGDDVLIGGNCKIYDTDFHSIRYEDRMKQPDLMVQSEPVCIKEGAFIGAHSIILKGVTIGEKSVIAAGSVVTRSVPPNELWGGGAGKAHSKDKRKIVCHIMGSILPSGAETMLENSGDLWEEYERYMVATAGDVGTYVSQCENAGYTVVHIPNHHFFTHHREIRKFLRKIKPDVVHIHRESQESYYALDARLAGVKNVVRTVHNVFEFPGILRIRRILTRSFGRALGTKYIAIGKSVYDNEWKHLFNRPKRLIDNWCDERKFHFISDEEQRAARNDMRLEDDTFVILSVGNCSTTKNHILLLKALLIFIEKNPSVKLLCFHGGHGDEEEREKEFIKTHKLESYVKFEGYIDPAFYFRLADLFVMPSLYEGVGISVIEAMFSGVPCLMSDVVGLKDFKELGNVDIYYSSLNAAEFASQLERLYQKFLSGKLHHSKSLSDAAKEKYNRRESVKKYLEVYEEK